MKTGTIYMLTSPSGNSYVGQTIHFEARMYKYKTCDQSTGKALRDAIKKYGFENFKVTKLFEDVPQEDLDALEIHTIWLMDTYHNGYNLNLGGNSKRGYKVTDETKQKISETLKGYQHSDETKKKISETKTGVKTGPHTEETKRKISDAQKGIPRGSLPEEQKRKISDSLKGRPSPNKGNTFSHSDETKQKLSTMKKGKPLSEETKRKMSEAAKRRWVKHRANKTN